MAYGRSFRRLASLAVLALLVPAACGGTANQEGAGGGPSGGDGTSCAQAVDITEVVDRGGAYSGRATADGDFHGLCASQKGGIEYLRFDATPGNYEITLSGSHDSAAANAVLDVRTDCASSASELGCDPHAVSPPTLVGVEKAGPVFLVLSGDWYGKGYELRVKPTSKCAADVDCIGYYPQTLCATKSGVCYAPLACAAGTADCNADPNDGCETDTTKDTSNCGACGVACKGPNAKSGTCAASACVLACDSSYADCDKDPSNGCETYLPGDGANCDACGKDCMHGGCAASTCTAPPVALSTNTAISENDAIALDAAHVYVGGGLGQSMGGVLSIPKSGGPAVLIGNDDCVIQSMLVDAGTVYWAGRYCGDPGIKSVSVAGGTTTVIATDNVHEPAGLIADATSLYWYDTIREQILSVPKAGGASTILAQVTSAYGSLQILGLAADATTLYFTTSDYNTGTAELHALPKSGGNPHNVAPLPPGSSGQLAISGTDLYVSTDTNIAHISTTGGPLTTFTSANLGSAGPSANLAVTSMAIAGGNLYWSEGATSNGRFCPTPGGIWKIPLTGGAAAELANDESPGPIAADASGVYMSATCSGDVALRTGP